MTGRYHWLIAGFCALILTAMINLTSRKTRSEMAPNVHGVPAWSPPDWSAVVKPLVPAFQAYPALTPIVPMLPASEPAPPDALATAGIEWRLPPPVVHMPLPGWPAPAPLPSLPWEPAPGASPQPMAMQPAPAPLQAQPMAMQPAPAPLQAQPMAMQPAPVQAQPMAMQPGPVQAQPMAMQPGPVQAQPMAMQPAPVQTQPVPVQPAPSTAAVALPSAQAPTSPPPAAAGGAPVEAPQLVAMTQPAVPAHAATAPAANSGRPINPPEPQPMINPRDIKMLPFQEAHWQGIEVVPLTAGLAKVLGIPTAARGVVADDVTMPADVEGFRAGDLITSVGQVPTPSLDAFIQAAHRVRERRRAEIELSRKGATRRMVLTAVNGKLGTANGETAPMIRPGARAPHGYQGACTNCHHIGTTGQLPADPGDLLVRVAPPIRTGQTPPHRDRGSCTACHQILP